MTDFDTGCLSHSTSPAAHNGRRVLCDVLAIQSTVRTGISHPPKSTSAMSQIDEDVFALIASELLQPEYGGSRYLMRLSVCCRHLRYLSVPTLFSRCMVTTISKDVIGVPPPVIRPHVRHLTYRWDVFRKYYTADCRPRPGKTSIEFGAPLRYLPFVRSLKFSSAYDGVDWTGLELCLSFPQVKSISFGESAMFLSVPPYSTDVASMPSSLEELRYPGVLFPSLSPQIKRKTAFDEVFALERACLSTLALGMNSTARSLVLPMATAPLSDISTVDWPSLQTFTLEGVFPTNADHRSAELLPSMFCRMPALRRLIITAALTYYNATRCCLLGSRTCAVTTLERLQSLTIAYPNPDDRVFSIPLPDLTHLSLRDWPRHYDIIAHKYYNRGFRSPILSATEALSILRRLQTPVLATLELVYFADEADDDLLAFIAHAFPKLRHLELHRYRSSSEGIVDHGRIAQALSVLQSLVSLRLNLDFQGDPGEYEPDLQIDRDVLSAWCSQLSTFGWEILSALELCASLEDVALLYRGDPPGMWVWFSRSKQAIRECVYDRASKRRDTFLPPYLRGGLRMRDHVRRPRPQRIKQDKT